MAFEAERLAARLRRAAAGRGAARLAALEVVNTVSTMDNTQSQGDEVPKDPAISTTALALEAKARTTRQEERKHEEKSMKN